MNFLKSSIFIFLLSTFAFARSLDDIKKLVQSGASAVAAGAFFVFHGPHRAVLITYPKYRELEELLKNEN